MNGIKAIGFWCYVREDDEAEKGRISRLARAIQSEYEVLTGEAIEIFIDRDVAWGEEWQRRIDTALEGTTFLIPVVTPRFFKSRECRRELLTFDMHAMGRNAGELLMPLLYVDVAGLEVDSGDEAMALVARTQYEDWTNLRLETEDSAEYRRGVNKLARRLVEVAELLATRPEVLPEPSDSTEGDDPSEDPGLIDIMAEAEEAMPRWQITIERFAELMQEIASASTDTTDMIQRSDARGKGFAGRLTAARQLSQRLDPLASELMELGTRYGSDLVSVDSGVLILIRRATEQELTDEERADACRLFAAIRELAEVSSENVRSLTVLVGSIGQVAQMSRDLRPPLRSIETGLQRVMDGQAVMDEWIRLIEEVRLDCSDVTPS